MCHKLKILIFGFIKFYFEIKIFGNHRKIVMFSIIKILCDFYLHVCKICKFEIRIVDFQFFQFSKNQNCLKNARKNSMFGWHWSRGLDDSNLFYWSVAVGKLIVREKFLFFYYNNWWLFLIIFTICTKHRLIKIL